MNQNGLMDKWIVGLVPASLAVTFHTRRSSRRKAAPYTVFALGQEKFEPPYVGCYGITEFQPAHQRVALSPHQSNNPVIHQSSSAASC